MHYLDTSVLAAYYHPEPRSAQVQQVLRDLHGPTISPLVKLELHSALAIKVRRGDLAPSQAGQIVSLFHLHVGSHLYRIVPIGPREYERAQSWIGAFRSPLRTLDGLHLATAYANQLTLVTADRALAESAAEFGVSCQEIQ